MKKLFAFGFLIISFVISAQQILIPFRVGDKFGLIDESDKMILEPQFEDLVWLGDEYFQTTQKIRVKDKLETDPGKFVDRDEEIYVKSLLYKGREFISENPYTGFQVFPGLFIQSRFEGDAEKLSLNQNQFENLKGKGPMFFLYNMKGENVHPEGYRRLELVDSAGTSSRNPIHARYALFFTENFKNQFQMCVFDADEGKFKECLFRDVADFKLLDADLKEKIFYLGYKDAKGTEHKKSVSRKGDYFQLEDFVGAEPEKRTGQEILKEKMENKPEVVPTIEQKKHLQEAVYILGNDSLFYDADGKRQKIPLYKKIEPLFIQPYLPRQKEDLIYKKEGKFGFIRNGKLTEAEFDSLAYFGVEHYLACKKINSQLKCGTLDLSGKSVIPMEYDSIFGQMKVYELNPKSGKLEFAVEKKAAPIKIEPKSISYYLKTSQNITVYKNGKMGILKMDNQEVIPLIYDEIGLNEIKTRGLANHRFVVLKKDGNYGVIISHFNRDTQESGRQIIEPIFPEFPAFYFQDYYGKKGFHLFGLMDENGKLLSYASEIGRVYRKNN